MAEPSQPLTKALLRRALPEPVLRAIRVFRELPARARAALPRIWLKRWFSAPQPPLPNLPPAPRLLFVCRGNILRSALAEGLFQRLVAQSNGDRRWTAASAGTAANEGNPADPRGLRVAQDLGVDLSRHRSRQLSQPAVDQADLILVMDYLNEVEVVAQFPAAAPKVRLLGSFGTADSRPREIQDPYSGTEQDVRAAFDSISAAVRHLITSLSRSPVPSAGNSRTETG